MKNLLLFFTFLVSGYSLFAQQRTITSPVIPSEAYYLKISKQQRNGATGFIIGGGAIALAGGFIWFISPVAGLTGSGDVKGLKRTGQHTVLVGAGLAAVSIPLFISSKKNKEKALLYAGTSNNHFPLQTNRDLLCFGTKINF